MHEGDEPDVLAHLRDADVLSGKDLAEIHLPGFEADAAAVRHGDRLIVKLLSDMSGGAAFDDSQGQLSVTPVNRLRRP